MESENGLSISISRDRAKRYKTFEVDNRKVSRKSNGFKLRYATFFTQRTHSNSEFITPTFFFIKRRKELFPFLSIQHSFQKPYMIRSVFSGELTYIRTQWTRTVILRRCFASSKWQQRDEGPPQIKLRAIPFTQHIKAAETVSQTYVSSYTLN